jgi:HD-GYP domain-containing protein (c-di-GMP phosphodiesterase class II)
MPDSKVRLQTILAGTALTLLLFALGIKFSPAVEQLNNAVTTIQIGMLPAAKLSPIPVIVEVDEKSLAVYGQWPWPRYQVARLLKALQRYGASAVGVDALFIERDRTSPSEIQRVMERDFRQAFPLAAIKESLWDYDAILGQTLKTSPFVLSYFFTFDKPGSNACKPKSVSGAFLSANGGKSASLSLLHAFDVVCNIPPVQQAADNSGFTNVAPDSDGLYRKMPLVIEYKDRLYPSLALQTFLTANGLDHFLLSSSETGFSLQLGDMHIPLDNSGNLLVKFPHSEQGFEKISASDILSGKLETSHLKDKIVFVGFSAAGLHEFYPTPYATQFLGVEFHAAIVDNLLRKDFLYRPNNAQLLELGVAAMLGIALFVALAVADPIASVAVPSLLIVFLLVLSQLLLANTGIVISPAPPIIMTLCTFLTLALIKYVRSYLYAKQMALMFARAQEGIIVSFSSMSEFRDPETGGHIKRTQSYVKALAKHLQKHSKFKALLPNKVIELLFKAAPLHDIGKVGIRDDILLKPGPLSSTEFEIMKSHPQIGANIIQAVATQSDWNSFMKIAYQICLYHQEKWDGSGYPKGLAGEAIPLAARLMALADVYDALISKRVYKHAFSHCKAVSIIRKGRGNHFDPFIVEAFEAIQDQFKDIALRFIDSDAQRATLLEDDD